MKFAAYIRLCRLWYSLPTALGFALAVLYAGGQGPETLNPALGLATTAIFLVLAGACVLNDAADVEYDRFGAPDRPIPAGEVSRSVAAMVGMGLWVFGVALGSFVGPTGFPPALWAAALGLLLYDMYSKRLGVLKPWLAAALRTAVFPLAVVFAEGLRGSRGPALVPLAGGMFFSWVAGEVLRDIRDRRSDAQMRGRTNGIQRRPRTWLYAASWLILLGAVVLPAAAFLGCRPLYVAGLPVLLAVALWAALTRHYVSKLQLLNLEIFLTGLLAALDGVLYGF